MAWLAITAVVFPCIARGALRWETQVAQLAAKSNERKIAADFRFKNTGSAVITITGIVPSCGCVATELGKRVYAPGETGVLKTTLAIESQAGLQTESVAVFTDDAPGQPAYLRLQAEIRPLVVLSPTMLAWRMGEEATEEPVVVAAASALGIASFEIKTISPPAAAAARVEAMENGKGYRVWVRPVSTAKPLNFTISGTAGFADGTAQEVVIYGAANAGVRADPGKL
jgi:hypothetical protein